MSDNQYIKKQQRGRRKLFLTTRHILMIMLLSAIIYGGFYYEYGRGLLSDGTCDGACESLYSLKTWVLGFLIMFSVVIAAGTLVGGLVAFLKWSRGSKGDTLSALTADNSSRDSNQEKSDQQP